MSHALPFSADEPTLVEQLAETRRELAAARVAAKKAAVTQEQFLARMSHELRTPLNAIVGFAELLTAEVCGPLGSPRYLDYARDIHRSGQRLSAILTDVLEMAKIEAGQIALVEAEIDPAALASSAVQLVRAEAGRAGVRLDLEAPPAMPKVMADERAFRRAIVHILGNAVKFTPAGGHVRVALRVAPGSGLEVAVSDTGMGMDMADVPRLLQPFAQGTEDLSRTHEGGGLGLSVAKALMELHDGRLQIRSKPGVGSVVTLILPPYRICGGGLPEEVTVLGVRRNVRAHLEARLVLEYGTASATVFNGSGNCLVGRNRDKPNEVRCDLVVDDRRVSRPHARIRYEDDGFYLVDQSQSGTAVVPDGQPGVFIEPGSPVRLVGNGAIYLGVGPSCTDMQPIRYREL